MERLKLLCISNGHGEDEIARRILVALQQWPQAPELAALPVVGVGTAYHRAGVPIVGPVQAMPSGGFVYMDGRQLVRDVQSGLVQLTLAQMRSVKAWAVAGGFVLAVGDIVPLALAWLSGAPYAFVGTAKSDYWLQDDAGYRHDGLPWFDRFTYRLGSVYAPWERWLMTHPRCRVVFPRDGLTTTCLQALGVPAVDVGNPMMDDLIDDLGLEQPCHDDADALPRSWFQPDRPLKILLLPGSRYPEAHTNWQLILQAVEAVTTAFAQQALAFLAALDPRLPMPPFVEALVALGWQLAPSSAQDSAQESAITRYDRGGQQIHLSQAQFGAWIHQADVTIAMAGTATEQFVGLGKPAITLPGQGPQFTAAFADVQRRLLGCSVVMVPSPQDVPRVIQSLGEDLDYRLTIRANGRRRMGEPGASQRIAAHLAHLMTLGDLLTD